MKVQNRASTNEKTAERRRRVDVFDWTPVIRVKMAECCEAQYSALQMLCRQGDTFQSQTVFSNQDGLESCRGFPEEIGRCFRYQMHLFYVVVEMVYVEIDIILSETK